MKRQPSQLKAELGAHRAWEKEVSQRKVLICKLGFSAGKCSEDLWQGEFLDPGLCIELLVICGLIASPQAPFCSQSVGWPAEVWGIDSAMIHLPNSTKLKACKDRAGKVSLLPRIPLLTRGMTDRSDKQTGTRARKVSQDSHLGGLLVSRQSMTSLAAMHL